MNKLSVFSLFFITWLSDPCVTQVCLFLPKKESLIFTLDNAAAAGSNQSMLSRVYHDKMMNSANQTCTRRSINIIGGRKTQQGWGRPVVLLKWRHHVFAYMLRLIKQYATDGVYLTGTRAAKAYITSEMTWQKNLFDFYLVTCWILNMDVRNFEHFQGVFIIQFSLKKKKLFFPLFFTNRTMKCAEPNHRYHLTFKKVYFFFIQIDFALWYERGYNIAVCGSNKNVPFKFLFKKTKDDHLQSNMVILCVCLYKIS